jgi:hypothetical protein
MEESPSLEANGRSAIPEIVRLLWNPKYRYHVRMRHLFASILSHMNPVHPRTSYFFQF